MSDLIANVQWIGSVVLVLIHFGAAAHANVNENTSSQATSNRSLSITFVQAATKSLTNFSLASEDA
jgi:hypothetical protein